MEINIKEYLSEEDIKRIVQEEFRKSLSFKEKDIERIISNTAFSLIWQKVDELFDEDITTLLSNKIKALIDGMTTFNIFKKPDVWDKESNNAYKYLQECIENNKDRIKEIVYSNIEIESLQILKSNVKDVIRESIISFYEGV